MSFYLVAHDIFLSIRRWHICKSSHPKYPTAPRESFSSKHTHTNTHEKHQIIPPQSNHRVDLGGRSVQLISLIHLACWFDLSRPSCFAARGRLINYFPAANDRAKCGEKRMESARTNQTRPSLVSPQIVNLFFHPLTGSQPRDDEFLSIRFTCVSAPSHSSHFGCFPLVYCHNCEPRWANKSFISFKSSVEHNAYIVSAHVFFYRQPVPGPFYLLPAAPILPVGPGQCGQMIEWF